MNFCLQFDVVDTTPDGTSVKRTTTKFVNRHTTLGDIWSWYEREGGKSTAYRLVGNLSIVELGT